MNTATLGYILNKYDLSSDDKTRGVIEIPNVGRNNLAALLHELGFKTGVEVGVQRGRYSEVLCHENPQMKVYGVDAWKHFKTLNDYAPQETCDLFYEEAKARMAPYQNYEIIRAWSMDAVKKFKDESLDFVYIDANHEYPFVMEDLSQWSKKIRKGGIISGHDYYVTRHPTRMQVKEALDDYIRTNNTKPLIVWGLKADIPGNIRDKRRSWSFVKT